MLGQPVPIPPYPAFAPGPPVVPKLYWDSISQEQRIKRLCEELHRICEYANMLGVNINADHRLIEQLLNDFESFKESGFLDYYEEQLEKWINDNVALLFTMFAKMVFFGLTDNGYFCAYIPESWFEITFDTGMVYGRFDYGRLLLRYDADGSGVIDNTGRYDDETASTLVPRVEALEHTIYTPISQGGA